MCVCVCVCVRACVRVCVCVVVVVVCCYCFCYCLFFSVSFFFFFFFFFLFVFFFYFLFIYLSIKIFFSTEITSFQCKASSTCKHIYFPLQMVYRDNQYMFMPPSDKLQLFFPHRIYHNTQIDRPKRTV